MEELISIIIPVYNNIEDLERCLTSIKNQTYGNFECLLIDDGSTDGSGEYLDNFAKSDDRFKVFHKENGGVSSARNFGLDRISGEWITFIDGDDEVLPDYLKILYESATENDCESALCQHIALTKQEQREEFINSYKPAGELKVVEINNRMTKEGLTVMNHIGMCYCQLYKSSLLEGKRFLTDVYMSEDIIFTTGMLLSIKKMVFVPYKLYLYKKWGAVGSSLTKSTNIEKRCSKIGKLQIIYQQFDGINKPLFKLFRYFYIGNILTTMLSIELYDGIIKRKKFLCKELRRNLFVYLFHKNGLKSKMLYLALCIAPQLVLNRLRRKSCNN